MALSFFLHLFVLFFSSFSFRHIHLVQIYIPSVAKVNTYVPLTIQQNSPIGKALQLSTLFPFSFVDGALALSMLFSLSLCLEDY